MENEKINQLYRDPVHIVFEQQLDFSKQLEFEEVDFNKFLKSQHIQIFISREYEHLLLQLHASNETLEQRSLTLPHPCGIALDQHYNLWVASTRNPNQIVKFKSVNNIVFPQMKAIIPGNSYLHDLVFQNKNLWATITGKDSFGQWNSDEDNFELTPLFKKSENKHQVNSIAFDNNNIKHFTVSTLVEQSVSPGDLQFKVHQEGGVINEKNEVICTGLTRPHSLRFHRNKFWVCNSGEGEFGYIENGKFSPIYKASAWTRGLAFHNNYAIIGLSKILPRFEHYAPGVSGEGKCGLIVLNLTTHLVEAEIEWPNGNQHFGIEICDANSTGKFPSKIELKEMKLEPFYSLI